MGVVLCGEIVVKWGRQADRATGGGSPVIHGVWSVGGDRFLSGGGRHRCSVGITMLPANMTLERANGTNKTCGWMG